MKQSARAHRSGGVALSGSSLRAQQAVSSREVFAALVRVHETQVVVKLRQIVEGVAGALPDQCRHLTAGVGSGAPFEVAPEPRRVGVLAQILVQGGRVLAETLQVGSGGHRLHSYLSKHLAEVVTPDRIVLLQRASILARLTAALLENATGLGSSLGQSPLQGLRIRAVLLDLLGSQVGEAQLGQSIAESPPLQPLGPFGQSRAQLTEVRTWAAGQTVGPVGPRGLAQFAAEVDAVALLAGHIQGVALFVLEGFHARFRGQAKEARPELYPALTHLGQDVAVVADHDRHALHGQDLTIGSRLARPGGRLPDAVSQVVIGRILEGGARGCVEQTRLLLGSLQSVDTGQQALLLCLRQALEGSGECFLIRGSNGFPERRGEALRGSHRSRSWC